MRLMVVIPTSADRVGSCNPRRLLAEFDVGITEYAISTLVVTKNRWSNIVPEIIIRLNVQAIGGHPDADCVSRVSRCTVDKGDHLGWCPHCRFRYWDRSAPPFQR